ncbi:hypothetical protein D9757_004972 [Collybiopsis confluens]|uniref:DUF7918 domain-containing protein n=1 Tax=Collybiopsis confluens TaxID=2823264 RepID=A0A8H5MD08_9AGAR|nr:hypothetical protein D9757_004972 [Collybiopsis confluens]
MVLFLHEFRAWIIIEGSIADEHQFRYLPETNTVCCWIASEAGKGFQVHWEDTERKSATDGHLVIDGNPCGGKVLSADPDKPSFTSKEGIRTSPTTVRPFRFSQIQLTDDDTRADPQLAQTELGQIELLIFRVEIRGEEEVITRDVPTQQLLHERAKKAIQHQTTFGDKLQKSTPRPAVRLKQLSQEPVARFRFLYRPLEMLQAKGILSLPAHQVKAEEGIQVDNTPQPSSVPRFSVERKRARDTDADISPAISVPPPDSPSFSILSSIVKAEREEKAAARDVGAEVVTMLEKAEEGNGEVEEMRGRKRRNADLPDLPSTTLPTPTPTPTPGPMFPISYPKKEESEEEDDLKKEEKDDAMVLVEVEAQKEEVDVKDGPWTHLSRGQSVGQPGSGVSADDAIVVDDGDGEREHGKQKARVNEGGDTKIGDGYNPYLYMKLKRTQGAGINDLTSGASPLVQGSSSARLFTKPTPYSHRPDLGLGIQALPSGPFSSFIPMRDPRTVPVQKPSTPLGARRSLADGNERKGDAQSLLLVPSVQGSSFLSSTSSTSDADKQVDVDIDFDVDIEVDLGMDTGDEQDEDSVREMKEMEVLRDRLKTLEARVAERERMSSSSPSTSANAVTVPAPTPEVIDMTWL